MGLSSDIQAIAAKLEPYEAFAQFPLPPNPERTVALRKLLEAKDAAVPAVVAKAVP